MKTDRFAFLFLMVIAYASLVLPVLSTGQTAPQPGPDATLSGARSPLRTAAVDQTVPARPIGS